MSSSVEGSTPGRRDPYGDAAAERAGGDTVVQAEEAPVIRFRVDRDLDTAQADPEHRRPHGDQGRDAARLGCSEECLSTVWGSGADTRI
jgi:hypothetical protein